MSLPKNTPSENAHVYHVLPGMTIAQGTLGQQDGAAVWVDSLSSDESVTSYESRRVPRPDVFTTHELGGLALDLMDLKPGETRSFHKLMENVLSDPVKANELAVRMSVASLERRADSSRPDTDFGVQSVGELVGDATTRGSNIWKVNELVSGHRSGMYNLAEYDLNLAYSSAGDLALLPPARAREIKHRIDEINREVLARVYDEKEVDFSAARVYEKTTPRGIVERRTVYPFGDGSYSFIERAYADSVSGEPKGATPMSVTVMIGQPEFSLDDGYLPAV